MLYPMLMGAYVVLVMVFVGFCALYAKHYRPVVVTPDAEVLVLAHTAGLCVSASVERHWQHVRAELLSADLPKPPPLRVVGRNPFTFGTPRKRVSA